MLNKNVINVQQNQPGNSIRNDFIGSSLSHVSPKASIRRGEGPSAVRLQINGTNEKVEVLTQWTENRSSRVHSPKIEIPLRSS